MFHSRNREETLYALARLMFLGGIIALINANVFRQPMDMLSFNIISVTFVLLTVAVMYVTPQFPMFFVYLLHVLDLGFLCMLIFLNGGADCSLAYIAPLYVVTITYFFGRLNGVVFTFLILGLELYLLMRADVMDFLHASFWTAYSGCILFFSMFMDGRKAVRHYRTLFQETEKREKYLERSLTLLEQKHTKGTVIDEATGLNNFRYFRDRIDKEIKRGARQRYIFAVCIMSVDGLDLVKRKYSPDHRLRILEQVAKQLIRSLRDTDLVARFHDNEFMFLLVDTDPRKGIIPVLRIRDKLNGLDFGLDARDRLHFSFGLAGFPADGREVGTLISMASASLRRSHQRGQGQVTLASSLARDLG